MTPKRKTAVYDWDDDHKIMFLFVYDGEWVMDDSWIVDRRGEDTGLEYGESDLIDKKWDEFIDLAWKENR